MKRVDPRADAVRRKTVAADDVVLHEGSPVEENIDGVGADVDGFPYPMRGANRCAIVRTIHQWLKLDGDGLDSGGSGERCGHI